MIVLSLDYGRRKVGVALSLGMIAEPLCVVRGETSDQIIERTVEVVKRESPNLLIVGLSESTIAAEAESFGRNIEELTGIKVKFVDETLSTFDAAALSIASGMRRKKRKDLEDAFSAAVILQRYLDGEESSR